MKRALVTTLVCLITVSGPALGDTGSRAIFVNQVRLNEQQVQALQSVYQTRIPDGHYWYDTVSGLWGMQGGPVAGQTLPGLNIGGPLRADASNGNTGVFINRREVRMLELQALQLRFGRVVPGRYWLNSRGIGGIEGGPAIFTLNVGAQRGSNGYIRRTPGGTIGSDGSCYYYSHPNGSSVMGSRC
ncbi:MAG: hypothetical protein ACE5K1_03490 [Acidiferrobacterales bacterium]